MCRHIKKEVFRSTKITNPMKRKMDTINPVRSCKNEFIAATTLLVLEVIVEITSLEFVFTCTSKGLYSLFSYILAPMSAPIEADK